MIQFRTRLTFKLFLFLGFVSSIVAANANTLENNATGLVIEPHTKTSRLAVDYLPKNTKFISSIQTPEQFLGFEVGKWHVRHDQLLAYMQYLAKESDRITLINTGKTHQDRQLVLLAITSANNQQQLETIRQDHISAIEKGKKSESDAPLVLYMGYSIHGNEPSGSNAALLLAYYLAAGEDERITKLLKEAVVLLDPSLNPDGLSRFAQWANQHRGKQPSKSPYHREHSENFPSGRTNYYWFDLNRDWLLLTHPESVARVKQFQAWRPHVLTDFHEMGTNSTYFFQPGVPSRRNPLTPDANVTLTAAIAEFHAQALDNAGELYFTEEGYDDFYYGKGSTYPDAHGSIGILFEQASSRGHLQSSINGDLAFDRTIQNQVLTSLSTIDGALANKIAILDYQLQFKEKTKALIDEDKVAGVAISQSDDPMRLRILLDKLDLHKISYQVITEDRRFDDIDFIASQSVFIPFDQPQYRLIKSLFSERTSFPDNTFYDVSNWNIGFAFGLPYTNLTSRQARQLQTNTDPSTLKRDKQLELLPSAVAYAFDWQHHYAPALTQALLKKGVVLRVANKSFTANTAEGERQFKQGSMIIPKGLNPNSENQQYIAQIAQKYAIPIWSLTSGLTPSGIDLGSENMLPASLPEVLVVSGFGMSQYEVGEIWHYIDTHVGAPVTLVDQYKLKHVDLSQFTHIIVASGNYWAFNDSIVKDITRWVKEGGTLIGQKRALPFFNENKLLDIDVLGKAQIDALFSTSGLHFSDRDSLNAKKLVAGAVFSANIDLTHPMFFGFANKEIPLFKTSNLIVENNFDPFTTVATYTANPLKGGYASKEIVEQISQSAAVVIQPKGKGRVIGFVDNVNFRGYWYGTSKMMSNALFLSGLMN